MESAPHSSRAIDGTARTEPADADKEGLGHDQATSPKGRNIMASKKKENDAKRDEGPAGVDGELFLEITFLKRAGWYPRQYRSHPE